MQKYRIFRIGFWHLILIAFWASPLESSGGESVVVGVLFVLAHIVCVRFFLYLALVLWFTVESTKSDSDAIFVYNC